MSETVKQRVITKFRAKIELRNTLIVTDFDTYEGTVKAIVEIISGKYNVSPYTVRNVLRAANKIGRIR